MKLHLPSTDDPLIVRERLMVRVEGILRRHVSAEDVGKSDDDLVRSVFARYRKARGEPIIDPNE
jgi:hypothetical protein